MSRLFSPFSIRGLTLANRVVVSPMCMYSAGEDGRANEWHLVHLGSRAVGRAGLVFTEATSVEARGRISARDLGLWSDDQIEPLARVVRFCHAQGTPIGVQLAHAGRKAWSAEKGRGPDVPVAPSAVPFAADWVAPRALAPAEIDAVVAAWRDAARRALAAGFDAIEIHHAHGYLLHEFLSPLANQRTDEYGGPLENRARLSLRVASAIREVWPADKPLFLRVSASDWLPGGVTPQDFVRLAPELSARGVDVIDCSSGAVVPGSPPPSAVGPGYQVPFAETIRREGGIPTMAVGLITEPAQAERIIETGQADLVALARGMLRDPYWAIHAAGALGHDIEWPQQYLRAKA